MKTSQTYAWMLAQLKELLDQLMRREADLAYVEAGGKVYYGIDNDVIKDVTAPWSASGRTHLDALFVNGAEAREAFAFVFSEHVLNGVHPGEFLIVPPGENELDGLWNRVYETAMREAEDLEGRLQRFNPDEIKSLSDQNVFDTVQQVVNVVYGGASAISELKRINRIAQTGAVRRLEVVLDQGSSPFPAVDSASKQELLRLETAWLNALQRARPDKGISNQVDAAVLARVEWTNVKLTRGKSKTKLLFVTGDPHIQNVAEQIGAFGGPAKWRDYLRSPVCFMDDIEAFPKSRTRTHQQSMRSLRLSEWLVELFWRDGRSTPGGRRSGRLYEEFIRARESWTQYIRSLGASAQMSKEKLSAEIELTAMSAKYLDRNEVAEVFELLRKRVSAIAQEALTGFSVSGALTRFWTLDAQPAATGGRGVPPVRFDSFKRAEKLAYALTQSNGLERAQLQLDRSWIKELGEDDESGYTSLIVFALAFGFAGEWKTGYTLSNLAYSVAKSLHYRDHKSHVKGDEAAYLCAVFGRLSATTLEEVDRGWKWLEIAQQLLRSSPLRKSLEGLTVSQMVDPRFTAEGLAIRVTERLFAAFVSSTGMRAALFSAVGNDDLVVEHIDALGHVEDLAQPPHIVSFVRYQLLVNMAQLRILDRILGHRSITNKVSDLVRDELHTQKQDNEGVVDIVERLGRDKKSDLIPFVLLGYLACYEPALVRARRTDLIAFMRRHASGLKTMEYDVDRAAAFIGAAEAALVSGSP